MICNVLFSVGVSGGVERRNGISVYSSGPLFHAQSAEGLYRAENDQPCYYQTPLLFSTRLWVHESRGDIPLTMRQLSVCSVRLRCRDAVLWFLNRACSPWPRAWACNHCVSECDSCASNIKNIPHAHHTQTVAARLCVTWH
jgi:hypothetical protein